jgi:predicted transcriptional regulator
MSAMSVRLPESLHQKLRELAEQENVSMNQMITLALAEKISALMTEEYLVQRAKRGSRKKFDRALSKVADDAPEDQDRIQADG